VEERRARDNVEKKCRQAEVKRMGKKKKRNTPEAET
jgi:hypothetical protein